jgi:hypothetical protein
MTKFETWVALGSLALGIMFVILILSFFNFLIGPEGKGPQTSVDPFGATVQIVSISGAPSLILAGVAFATARSNAERKPAFILIATGIIFIGGMSAARIVYSKINPLFVIAGLGLVPVIFILGGIGVAALGGYLLMTSKRARRNLEDKIL